MELARQVESAPIEKRQDRLERAEAVERLPQSASDGQQQKAVLVLCTRRLELEPPVVEDEPREEGHERAERLGEQERDVRERGGPAPN